MPAVFLRFPRNFRLHRLRIFLLSGLLVHALAGLQSSAQAPLPLLSWGFDERDGARAVESLHHADGVLSGVYLRIPGVRGKALRLDGETAGVTVNAAALPPFGSEISVEAWIAIDAYPWNWAPIVDQRKNEDDGFFFGVDADGHLGVQARIGSGWQTLAAPTPLPLHKWVHAAATIGADGMALYVDGQPVASSQPPGQLLFAPGQDLLIGRIRYAALPQHWIHPKFPVWFSFDGVLDELNVYAQALSPAQVQVAYHRFPAPARDALTYPKLPSGPPGKGSFGAFYATLPYDTLWDAPRRVAPDSDVVVRFDDSPIRLVAWQGTNYIPAWVTENGKWYTDEFVETWGANNCPGGEDCEPMSDKQNRYAHVRILENTPARVVLHVHYGECEVEQDTCANPDPLTGWTDQADDYYTVYPDAVAARKTVAWSSKLQPLPEFQETIIINAAGQRPEDNIETDALTFLNMKGEQHTYSWTQPPKVIDQPSGANIQAVNLKSKWKPFQIVLPDLAAISVYQGERTWSMFEWWNHWPVAQVKSSGISAVAPDRPSHSSLSHIEGQVWERGPGWATKVMLDGLTDQPAAKLTALARSWARPPVMRVDSGQCRGDGYDPAQRAFVLKDCGVRSHGNGTLRLTFEASPESPLVNPALVVEHWMAAAPALRLNGVPQGWDKDARYGLVPQLEGGAKLVVWVRLQAASETAVEITPQPSQE